MNLTRTVWVCRCGCGRWGVAKDVGYGYTYCVDCRRGRKDAMARPVKVPEFALFTWGERRAA